MARRKYAEGTEVSIGRSRDEIENTLERFGASGQLWLRDNEREVVTIGFKCEERTYKFTIRLPPLGDFRTTPSGRWERTDIQAKNAQDAETRRRFRSLANYIKAILDAIDTGIIEAEEALMPYLVLHSGETVYERVQLQLKDGFSVDLSRVLPEGKAH